MNDGSRIQHPNRPVAHTHEHAGHEDVVDPSHKQATPGTHTVEETIQKNHDRYGMSLINKVMQGLRSLMLQRSGDTAQARAAGRAQLGQELSLFEKVFLAHFESGALLGDKLPPGLEKFLKKGEQEWSGFFNNLAPFAQKKSVPMSDIQALLFRGVTQTSPASKEGKNLTWLIVDMQLPAQPGRLQPTLEKFVRILLPADSAALQKTLDQLIQKNPGDTLSLSQLSDLLNQRNGSLECESLSYKIVDSKAVTAENKAIAESYQSPEQLRMASVREGTRQSTPGIALDARTEALMASQHLGHSQGSFIGSIKSSGNILKKKAAGEEEKSSENLQTQVPPYLLNLPKSRLPSFRGKPKWYIAFIYSVISTLVIIGAYYIVRHLL